MDALAASDRVVVLRTFSKALGMAGLRFGVALAHPAVAREIAKAKLPYNVNLFTLTAAEVALEHMDVRQDLVSRIIATRDRTFPRLSALPGHHGVPECRRTSSWCASIRRRRARCTGGCCRSTTSWCGTSRRCRGWSNACGSRWGRTADMVAVERALSGDSG